MSFANKAFWFITCPALAFGTLQCSSNNSPTIIVAGGAQSASGGVPSLEGGASNTGGTIADAGTVVVDAAVDLTDAGTKDSGLASDAATPVGKCPAQTAYACDPTAAPTTLDCSITDFGAVGDGVTDDTCAIQAALNYCGQLAQCHTTTATVHVSSGVFLSYPFALRSNVTLQFDGVQLDGGASDNYDASVPGEARIQFAPDPLSYQSSNGVPIGPGLINAPYVNNVTIRGNGILDGAGAEWWSLYDNTWSQAGVDPRPYLLNITNSTNITISDVTFRNSPKFHVFFQNCSNIDVHGITIRAPADSPNTDGVDPKSCVHVKISDCDISTGDDNVAISSNSRSGYARPTSDDTEVFGCKFGAGHGVSIGSPTYGDVGGMNVHDCTFDGTDNGLRIKSNAGSGGIVERITYTNIELKNVKNVIVLDGYYSDKASIPALTGDAGAVPTATANEPEFRDIYFKNINATGCGTAGIIRGRVESPFSNITLENVSIAANKGMTIRFAEDINFINSTIVTPSGVAPIVLQVDPSTVTGIDAMMDASVP